MKVWIANDNVLGYTIWKVEPFLIKNIYDQQMFVNHDLLSESAFNFLSKFDRRSNNIPEIPVNTYITFTISLRSFKTFF